MKKYINLGQMHILCVVLALIVGGYFYLVKSFMPAYIKEFLPKAETMASEYVNGNVAIGGLSWQGGLSADVENVTVNDTQGKKVVSLPKVKVTLRPWLGLTNPSRALTRVEITDPEVWLTLNTDNKWNLASLLKESDSEETPFYGLCDIEKGKLHVNTPHGNWDLGVDAAIDGGANPKFALEGKVTAGEQALKLSGLVTTKGIGKIQVHTDKLSLGNYAGLLKHYTTVESLAGDIVKAHVIWENNGKKAGVSGELQLADISGNVKVNAEPYDFVLNGKIKAANSILDIDKLHACLNKDYELVLAGKADVSDLDNVSGQGVLSSSKLVYGQYVVEDINLPFTVTKNLIQLDKASLAYGGGKIKASATADFKENTFTADFSMQNVKHVMSDKKGDVIIANGDIAVVGDIEQQGDKKNYKVHMAADTFGLSWQDVVLNKMALDGDFDGSKLTIDHFSAQSGEGVLAIKGDVVAAKDGALNLEGRVSDFAIGPALYHFANVQGKGNLSMGFKLGGSVSSPEFDTMVQLRKVEVLDLKLREMDGRVAMKDRILTIKDMGATLTKGRTKINGSVDFRTEDPALNFDIANYKVRVEPFVAMVTKDFSLTGNLDNTMRITGTVKHPSVKGELALTDGSIQKHIFHGVKGKYLYNDGFIRLEDFNLGLLIGNVKLSGTMTKDEKLDFAISAPKADITKTPYKLQDYDIAGLFAVDGHVRGTLKAPNFEGKISSNEVTVNGEKFTNVNGSVNSDLKSKNNFDIGFAQPHMTAQKTLKGSAGSFQAKGNLDLDNKFMSCVVSLNNGDIKGLLRAGKLDYALEGSINGSMNFCPQGKGSGVDFALKSNNIEIHKLSYKNFEVNGNLKDKKLTLQKALLQETDSTAKGYLSASGTYKLDTKDLDIRAEAVAINPAIVNIAMQKPLAIEGLMNLKTNLTGNLESPKGSAELELLNGSLLGVGFDLTKASITLANDSLTLKELLASKGEYSLTGGGTIPLDALRAEQDRRGTNEQMNLALDFDNTRLGILKAFKLVENADGDIKGKLEIKGTLDKPKVNGNIYVEDGTVKLHGVNTVFEHLVFDGRVDNSRLEVAKAEFKTGSKGTIKASGYCNIGSEDKDSYKFVVNAEDAEISYANMFKGRINSDLTISSQEYRDYWRPNRKNRTGIRPLISGTVRLDDVLANITTIPEDEIGTETNLGLDLQLKLGPKIHLQNAMFYDMWLSIADEAAKDGSGKYVAGKDVPLIVQGGYYSLITNNPENDEKVMSRHKNGEDALKITGKVKVDRGSVTYLRSSFKITEAELQWFNNKADEEQNGRAMRRFSIGRTGEVIPNLKLNSWSRLGRYRIYVRMNGSLSDITNENTLQLTSMPSLDRSTIIRMLALQRETNNTSGDINNDDINSLMNASLQMAVLGNVEMWVKQTLGLDQFKVYTGKVNSGVGFDGYERKKELTSEDKNRYNVLISKYLTDNFMIGYTTSINNEEKAVFGQYELDEHFNITYSEKMKNDRGRNRWIGVEYKIDF